MCTPNFDEISQSTAEIKQLPVSNDGRPTYWNFTSSFEFDLQCMSCCIHLRNFVVIGRTSADIWRHIDFSRWRS